MALRKVVQEGSYIVGQTIFQNNDWYEIITITPASEQTEEIRFEKIRPCQCGSGIHWANCPEGSQYCG